MKTELTFVIPIRHPAIIKDAESSKKLLEATLKSISAQTSRNWRCVVVANEGTLLPEMPNQCEVCVVDLAQNKFIGKENIIDEQLYDAIRFDKGQRVLSGMLHNPDSNYYMVVDDDDFVHNGLCEFVENNNTSNGWYIKNGYLWSHGSKLAIKHQNFSMLCGTSHIIKRELWDLPSSVDDISQDRIKSDFGSHIRIKEKLNNKDKPLAELPFYGAVYRVGHSTAVTGSKNILKDYFLNMRVLKHPKQIYWNFRLLSLVNSNFKHSFFGE